MKRIALLGATGSIGRQALEIIAAHPELELVAAASGSEPIDGLAPLTQVGGDLTELLERARPDVVLNAVVGFAGLPATLWALERGIDLALANKESLVAAGDLATTARRRPRRRRPGCSRLPGHAPADLVRPHVPREGRGAGPAARPRRRSNAGIRSARPGDVPTPRAGPPSRGTGWHLPVRIQCRQRGRSRNVPRGPVAVPRHRGDGRRDARRGRRCACAGPD